MCILLTFARSTEMSKRYTLNNPQQEIDQYKRRITVVSIFVGLLVLILVVRLFYLQIIEHKLYSTLSRQNLLSVAPVEPSRGLIFDRNGVLLASNLPVFSLEVQPNEVHNLKQTLVELSKIIKLTPSDIQAFYRQLNQQRRFDAVPLRVKLTNKEIAAFSVNQYRFPGIFIQAHMLRYYPFGSVMEPVLGYVGRITANELAHVDPTNYSATNDIGKTGVEKQYETLLHGKVGIQQIETNVNGQVIRSNQSKAATAGDNLYLTIDARLQMAATEILKGYAGAVVAIDPRNGQVLALVSTPGFDPNLFVTGISNKDFKALNDDPLHPMFNRALRGTFPPGSTVKPFYALEGLQTKTITPQTSLFDPGYYKLPGDNKHIYHNWKRSGFGWVDVETSIIQSCDTFFYSLAHQLGIDRLDKVLTIFGFGQPTGIDTYSENEGLVPTPAWKMRVHHQPWYQGDTVVTGIGQGYLLVTPLQLANALVTLVNHGQGYKPQVLLKIQTPKGQVQTAPSLPRPSIAADFKTSYWDLVLKSMDEVVSDPRGTGYLAGVGATYKFGGKSGTAQVFGLRGNEEDKSHLLPLRLRDDSWFEAFAPAKNPTVVVVVFVEHGGEGKAVFLMRKVLDAYFNLDKTPLPIPPSPAQGKSHDSQ